MKLWFCSLKKNNQIAILVLLAHIGAILWMSIDYCFSDHPKIRRPVVVRTIRPQAAPIYIAPSQNTPAAAPKRPVSQPTIAATPKTSNASSATPTPSSSSKTNKKKTVTISSAKKPAKAAAKPKIPAGALHEIEEGFNAIETKPFASKTSAPEIKLPAVIQSQSAQSISIDSNITQSSVPSTYHLCLIEQLQTSLQLPEIGDVKIKIMLAAPGTISSIQILDAKSKKNAEWLKNQLPLLSLPCFNDFGIVDAILEFTITFRNVENS